MQPYFFPYFGYFQLMMASDVFIFLNDVNFINRGWINRNRILINGEPSYFTVPLSKASQNRKIHEIELSDQPGWREKIKRSFELAYRKAPFFFDVFPLVSGIIDFRCRFIDELAIESVRSVVEYLGIRPRFMRSSESFSDNVSVKGADRLIDICSKLRVEEYINPPGGIDLYDKGYFQSRGIGLQFLQPGKMVYRQFGDDFIPNLSIIDTLMFCRRGEVVELLRKYKLA
jgi:hypothetical protein